MTVLMMDFVEDMVPAVVALVVDGTCGVVILETIVRLEVIICGVEGWDVQPAPVQGVV